MGGVQQSSSRLKSSTDLASRIPFSCIPEVGTEMVEMVAAHG